MTENNQGYLVSEVSEKLFTALGKPAKKQIVEDIVATIYRKMVEDGRAHLISEEEESLLKAFRTFKVKCKAGSVFRWQTIPAMKLVEGQEVRG